jgi:hypothetical protein
VPNPGVSSTGLFFSEFNNVRIDKRVGLIVGHEPVNLHLALLRVREHADGGCRCFANLNFKFPRRFGRSALVASLNLESVNNTLSRSKKSELVRAGDFTLRAESRSGVLVDNFVMASSDSVANVGP